MAEGLATNARPIWPRRMRLVRKQGEPMSDSIKRILPGGKVVTSLSAFAEGWRVAMVPILSASGWKLHSFSSDGVKLVSPDSKKTQVLSREFVEAISVMLETN